MTEPVVNADDSGVDPTRNVDHGKNASAVNLRWNSLSGAAERHINFEKASFHTPGHKGRLNTLMPGGKNWLRAEGDLTELPGLDELSNPQTVIAAIEENCAQLWGSEHTFLSVNGASAALMAAIFAARELGDTILMPRNAHRSAIQAIALAGLTPVWYEPVWETNWGFWGSTTSSCVQKALTSFKTSGSGKVAAILVVSPTYQGALSDIRALAQVARQADAALIVDEAHGAHYIAEHAQSAITGGADAVAHSLHKTLPGLTQTGLIHLPKKSRLNCASVKFALNSFTSSSPSYLLLSSIERATKYLTNRGGKLVEHFDDLKLLLENKVRAAGALRIYATAGSTTPSHILVSPEHEDPGTLYNYLIDRGIFPEAVLGQGVLFLLGAGSVEADIELLGQTLIAFSSQERAVSPLYAIANKTVIQKPGFQAMLPPHQVIGQKTEVVGREEAEGRISAEIVCPCPPGIPVLIPGQRITEEVLELTENKEFTIIAK